MHNVEDIKGATKRFARAEARPKGWAMRSANANAALPSAKPFSEYPSCQRACPTDEAGADAGVVAAVKQAV
jgi:hypothetical protein